MTKTIQSETDSRKHYFLSINDETSHAQTCTCKGFQYRGHCKHVSLFDEQVAKTLVFNELFAKYDCRANGDEVTRRCYYELQIGA